VVCVLITKTAAKDIVQTKRAVGAGAGFRRSAPGQHALVR